MQNYNRVYMLVMQSHEHQTVVMPETMQSE